MMSRHPAITPSQLEILCIDLVPVRVLGGREGCRVMVSTPSGPRELHEAGRRLIYPNLQLAAERLLACGVLRFEVDLTGALI